MFKNVEMEPVKNIIFFVNSFWIKCMKVLQYMQDWFKVVTWHEDVAIKCVFQLLKNIQNDRVSFKWGFKNILSCHSGKKQ